MDVLRIGASLVLASSLAACDGASAPSPTAAGNVAPPPVSTATASTPPIASVGTTPGPLVPAPAWFPIGEPLVPDDRTAVTVEQSGVRFTLAVETNPLFGTRDSWLLVTLENRGTSAIHWITDECEFHEGVTAVAAAAWAMGREQDGPAGEFKEQALEEAGPPIHFEVTPEAMIGSVIECGDIGTTMSLGPGSRIIERTRWTGETRGGFGVGPDSPLKLAVEFAPVGWHRDGEPEWSRAGFEVELVAGVVGGRDPAFLSPGQAIDVALSAEQFRAFVDAVTAQGLKATVLSADSDSAEWQVGAVATDGRRMVVYVDGLLGTVIDVIETP